MKKNILFFTLSLTIFIQIRAQTWQQTRGPYGGDVEALAANPENGFLLVATNTGLFTSPDQGGHWKKQSLVYTTDAVSFGNQNVLFAANFQGILRSADNGETWTTQNGGQTTGVRVVKGIPGGRVIAGGEAGVIQYSADNGVSWTIVHNGTYFNADVIGLAHSPGPDLLFAATDGQGVWKSADNGVTWISVNNAAMSDQSIYSLHVVSQTGTLFARPFLSPLYYRSTDDGDTWSTVPASPNWSAEFADNASSAVFMLTIFDGLMVSHDDGLSWTPENFGLPLSNNAHLAADHSGLVYVGVGFPNATGLFQASGDSNLIWELAGPTDMTTDALLYDAASHTLYAGTSDSIFVTDDAGQNWEKRNEGLTDGRISYLVQGAGLLFAGGIFSGIFKSADNGQQWTLLDNQPIGTFLNAFVGNASGYLFAATENGFYRSINNGDNWIPITNGIGMVLPEYLAEADPPGADHFMFGASYIISGVVRSTNASGTNWSSFNNGFSTIPTILSLATSPDGQFVYVGSSKGVWRSPSTSAAWVLLGNGLPNLPFLNIDVLFSPASQVLIASITGSGVFRSLNNGASWQPYNDGLTNLVATAFEVDENGYLYTGTDGGGVFRSAASITAISGPEAPEAVAFPNPAGGWLYVEGDLSAKPAWFVSDLQGRRYSVSGVFSAKGLRLNVSSLPAGLYVLYLAPFKPIKFLKN